MRITMPSTGAGFAPSTHTTPAAPAAPNTAATRPVPGRWHAFVRRLTTRGALLELDDDQLRDIGLSRYEARQEARLTLWRLWQ